MSTSAPPLSLILGGCPILFLQLYRLLFVQINQLISLSLSLPFLSPSLRPSQFYLFHFLFPSPPSPLWSQPSPETPCPACQPFLSRPQSGSPKFVRSSLQLSASAFVSCRLMRFFVISVFLTRFKKKKKKKRRKK